MTKKTTLMTVEELLHSSLVNGALDRLDGELFSALTSGEYRLIEEESEENVATD